VLKHDSAEDNPVKTGKALAAIMIGFLLFFPSDISYATECVALPPLKPIHHVCGFVVDPSSEPIPNAKVTILKDDNEVAAMQTNADGRFAFEQLKAGSYGIRVDANGFLSALSSIVLVTPGAACKKELGVLLDVGMGCSIISFSKLKKTK
jgi:Carboxypeptidase regulatory-like domain